MSNYASFSYRVPDNHQYSIVIDISIYGTYPQNQKIPIQLKALIDTGASRSAISSSFAQTTKLVSYEKCTIRTAKGEYISPVYTLSVMFPGGMLANNIKAAEFSGKHEFDFIVGMDILHMTDLAITNAGHVMILSMRSPPADKHIEFPNIPLGNPHKPQ